MDSKNGVRVIQSVQRAVDILNCFDTAVPSLSLNDISRMTGLNINTARGLVATLVANGLLLHDRRENVYHLGFYFIGRSAIIQREVEVYITMCRPYVDLIAEKYHVSASLQMVNQDEIISIYCAYPGNTAYYIILSEYSDLPKHATSSGKLLLYHNFYRHDPACLDRIEFKRYTPETIMDKNSLKKRLEEIARAGYSWEIEEFNLDVGSLAVPIFRPYSDRLFLTLSCTFFARALPDMKEDLVAELRSFAAKVQEQYRSQEEI